jgi:hypothetical protein
MTFRNLASFARWFLSQPFSSIRPQHNGVRFFQTSGGWVSGIVLFRDGQFQVELFCGSGAGYFPEHKHPNVDSIEVHLCGEIAFTINGVQMFRAGEISQVLDDGSSSISGKRVRVRPGVSHGATVGSTGGAFLSIQRWREGVTPTSVGLDWDGPQHVRVIGE